MYRPNETCRGVVYPWHIDHVGHMNVQFYTARFDEATWQFLGRLGLTPEYLRMHGRAAERAAELLMPDGESSSGDAGRLRALG